MLIELRDICNSSSFRRCVNGASDLFVGLLGDSGRHARTAVGVASLPRRAAVEVDAVFEID